MNNYKLGSLFDGSGGFPLAGTLCGIEPVWAAEVEPYPIAVTRSRFPRMKHLGDISKVNGAEIEPVDIITFGSPCQDLSVAGKRAGLKHEANGDEETTRSGLFMEAVRIIKEMRNATNGKYPTFALWENVPGAFSSNKGEDFRVVCEELIKIIEPTATMPEVPQKGWNYADSFVGDGWSLAYRVLDAQYWGVPQRRRRIYLVADFRGERAREVLFEREGLRGYFTQGRTPWQTTPSYAQGSSGADDREGEIPYTLKIRSGCEGGGKGVLIQKDKSATLACNNDQCLFQPKVVENHPADSRVNLDESGKVQTLTSRMDTGGGNVPMVMEPKEVICMATQQGGAEIRTDDKAPTLTAAAGMSGNNQPVICLQGNGIDRPAVAYGLDHAITTGGNCTAQGPCVYEDIQATLKASGAHAVAYCIGNGQVHDAQRPDKELSKTLNCMDDPMKVCIKIDAPKCYSQQAYDEFIENEVGCTLKARGGTYGGGSETLVSYGIDPGASRDVGDLFIEEQSKTITNGTCPGHHNGVVIADKPHYIVRRLTPTECARLQGFADRWGDIDAIDRMSAKDYQFWKEVRNTHDVVIKGKDPKDLKDYTVKQMLTWYNKLQTDSAEYKMWGNGIALPTALYVMQGIADMLDAVEMIADELNGATEPIEDWML